MRLLLGVSLAANLAVAGVAVGALLRHGGPDRHGPPRSLGVVLYRALPEDDRRALRAENRDQRGERRLEQADALETMLGALRNEPFDPAPIMVVLQEQGEATRARHLDVQQRVVALIAEMPGPERAAFADRIEDLANRHKPRN
ncbi:periplasmic heavy metal sensor [Lutimaribacter marinistellae]|uniref:Periplasmic heavy metal sensor n=1 Tax=Lutimaribacter marinistellae TaxID=1820329 RepID=A0ABV7TL74_9RHOB